MLKGLLTNKITLADGTELEGKYVIITNGFACVYDAPGDTTLRLLQRFDD